MKKENFGGWMIAIVGVLFTISLYANIAYSHEYHHAENVPRGTTTLTNEGIASAIATAQHNFDYGTHSWQGSVGIGAFDTNTAFSFGLAKRFNKTLINGSITQEEGKFGGGVGINWHF